MKISIGWKNTIFTRLIITFLIIIVPMYIIGVKVYDWAIKTVRVETSNYMRSQAEAIARSTLEKKVHCKCTDRWVGKYVVKYSVLR